MRDRISLILLVTLAEVGEAPSGMFFATLGLELDVYQSIVGELVSGELIKNENHLLRITSKGRALVERAA